jgi:predicted DNA-binding transcriptional regulator AlpA
MTKARAEIVGRLPIVFGLPEPEAAAALGIGPSKFRQMVDANRLPRPRRIDGKLVWDVEDLYAAFKQFPVDGEEPDRPDPGGAGWDDMMG